MNRHLRLLLPAALAATAGLVAACGGTTAGAAAGTPAPQSSSSASRTTGPGGGGAGGGRFGGPAASGTIAQVNAASIEVQNPSSGQSTVTFTARTVFTQQKKTSAAAITVGSCVVARSATSGGPATTVQVTKPVNGSCVGGGGFGGGSRPTGAPGGFPSGRPTAFPSAFPSGAPSGAERRNAGDVVFGKVTAVSGSDLTVAAVTLRPRPSSSSPGASAAPTTRTVTLAANATVTSDAAVTKRALKVGLCAAAFGSTDERGAVAATRIALSSPMSGQCTAGGFGRRGNG
ncbi:MAG TPA: hypothetical protein VH395_00700 [Jatrophihabitantaceae bacterium]